jgi:hypothetical protein
MSLTYLFLHHTFIQMGPYISQNFAAGSLALARQHLDLNRNVLSNHRTVRRIKLLTCCACFVDLLGSPRKNIIDGGGIE